MPQRRQILSQLAVWAAEAVTVCEQELRHRTLGRRRPEAIVQAPAAARSPSRAGG